MSTARQRFRTLSATLFESFDDRIIRRDDEFSGHGHEVLSDLFVAQPDRARIERRSPGGGLEFLVVLDGRQRSTYSPNWGAEVEEQERGDVRWALGVSAELLDPMPLLGALEMGSVHRGRVGDREVFRVGAKPRFPLPPALGFADDELLVVDAERGVVLELVGFIDGSPARTLELRDVSFDVEPTAETFAFDVPLDEEVSGLGLREAAQLASFRLWALPRPVQQITYRGARPDGSQPESVTIEYADVLIVETAADGVGWTSYQPPRTLERGGQAYWLIPGTAFFALNGTTLSLSAAGADDEQLIDLAEALVPVDG
jgi:hypothetical protein